MDENVIEDFEKDLLDPDAEPRGTEDFSEMGIKGGARYLINKGQASKLKIDAQKAVAWLDEQGRKLMVQTIFKDDDEGRDQRFGLSLTKAHKGWIYYINGEYRNVVVKPVGLTFTTYDFPHIINFPIGTSMMDERKYTLICGELNRIDRSEDADTILKNFTYVVETDEGGKPLEKRNEYLDNLNKRPARRSDTESIDHKSIETVSMESVRTSPAIDLVRANTNEEVTD